MLLYFVGSGGGGVSGWGWGWAVKSEGVLSFEKKGGGWPLQEFLPTSNNYTLLHIINHTLLDIFYQIHIIVPCFIF